jgi:hypothetical protein
MKHFHWNKRARTVLIPSPFKRSPQIHRGFHAVIMIARMVPSRLMRGIQQPHIQYSIALLLTALFGAEIARWWFTNLLPAPFPYHVPLAVLVRA